MTEAEFLSERFKLAVSLSKVGVDSVKKYDQDQLTVLSVLSCKKLEPFQSSTAARQQCRESSLLRFSCLNEMVHWHENGRSQC